MVGKNDDKHRHIVEVATHLFSKYGFKRTSVELLAAQAQVAKPTVYAYFENKEAIFRAVVQAVCDDMLTQTAAARDAGGAIEVRLAAMLSAKFTRYFELVQASPHAAELIGSQGELGEEIVKRADEAFLRMIIEVLDAEPGLEPARIGLKSNARVAQMLLRAGWGASYDAQTAAEHRRFLSELVRAVITGLRGG